MEDRNPMLDARRALRAAQGPDPGACPAAVVPAGRSDQLRQVLHRAPCRQVPRPEDEGRLGDDTQNRGDGHVPGGPDRDHATATLADLLSAAGMLVGFRAVVVGATLQRVSHGAAFPSWWGPTVPA